MLSRFAYQCISIDVMSLHRQQVSSADQSPPFPPTPGILTSDLLNVEACLQNHVRALETKHQELSRQVERGQLLLAEREERHSTELAELRLAHKTTIRKVKCA